MALSPIQLFQNNQSSLAQILAGGNQTITGIMDKAVQIGRDISNKQLAQERDLFAMRTQQAALDQRRGESLQQDYENTRRFLRGAFESNRDYGLRREGLDLTKENALFSREMAEKNYGLGDRRVQLAEDAAALEQERQRKLDEYYAGKYGNGADGGQAPPAEAPAASTAADLFVGPPAPQNAPQGTAPLAPADMFVGPPSPETKSAESVTSEGYPFSVWPRQVAAPAATDTQPSPADLLSPTTPQASAPTAAAPTAATAPPREPNSVVDLYKQQSELEADLRGVTDPRIRARIASQLGEVEGQIALLPKTATSTASSARSERSLQMREQAALDKKLKEEMTTYIGDTEAFVRPTEWLFDKYGSAEAIPNKLKIEASTYDKDPVTAEKNYAINTPTAEEYIKKVTKDRTLTPAQIEKRRKFWQWANGKTSSAADGSAGGTGAVRSLGI